MEGDKLKRAKSNKLNICLLCFHLLLSCLFNQQTNDILQKLDEILPPTPTVALDWTPLEKIPVSYEGRIVPFITFAQDTLFSIYGRIKYKKESATSLIFKIALSEGTSARNLQIINISSYKVKKELGLTIEKNYFSLEDIKDKIETITHIGISLEQKKQQRKELTNIENQLYTVFLQLSRLQDIITGNFYLVYDYNQNRWYKLQEIESLKDNKEYERIYKGILALSVAIGRESYKVANDIIKKGLAIELWEKNKLAPGATNTQLEFLYIKYDIKGKALYIFLGALIVSILTLLTTNPVSLKFISIFLSVTGFTLEVLDLIIRTIISSRAPVSSFYESIYYIGGGTFLFAFIFYIIFKNYHVFFCGILLNTLLLLSGPYSGLNPHIKVLMPALRSKWLIYHVHTITLSYSLFAISFILSHHFIIKYLIKKVIDDDISHIIYNIIKVGVVFLTIGIILGSIWGAEAWGRYWGWDPKETWALITLLGYLAIVHLKRAGTIQQFGVAIGSILSFFLVGVTYYGASFIFVGLHSYAGDNINTLLPKWLIITILIEIIFVSLSIYLYYNQHLSKHPQKELNHQHLP